jgi:hypothetical protein
MPKQKTASFRAAGERTSTVARASKVTSVDTANLSVPMLSEVVKLTRQFQRAVRLDTDYGTVEALQGYICQGTARNVLEATARHIVHSTQRAFTWTGPFGGGKSSLAVALCSLVAPDKAVRLAAFDVLSLTPKDGSDVSVAFSATNDGWLVLPVVGFRGGVVDAISECLDDRASTSIVRRTKSGSRQRTALLLKTLAELADAQSSNGILLVIDELGKFLEAAAVEGDDIYFYQELADLAGRCSGKLVVVGILHQSFEQYAHRLGSELRDEWRKVQGRYIDIPLVAASDEVVELTGQAIESAHPHVESLTISKQVAQSIRHRRPGLNASFAERLDRCWPLHPVTSALLGPVSKRRFGQNERSTFGFLASVEARSFREFLQATPASSTRLYSPSAYWDYLQTNLEPSILASPDSHRWSQSVEAVERTEQREKDHDFHVQLVKTIALIDLFRNGSGLVADEAVLSTCVTDADGALLPAAQVSALLQDLRRWAVVTFKRHLGSWAISEGSDFDLDAALTQALSSIDEPDLAQLGKLVRLQPVLAKRHYCETGTLRWMLPFMIHANRFLDGVAQAQAVCGEPGRSLGQSSAFGAFLVVLPARGQTLRQAANAVRKSEWRPEKARPILVGVPRNGETIRELGRELMAYDQIRRSRSELENDAVARRELDARTADVRLRLEEELRDALLNIQWIDLDPSSEDLKRSAETGAGTLSQLASTFADEVFSNTPHAFSELINRDAPSSNSIKARKDLLYAMLRHGDKDRLGLKGYPAEAGLYYNLLRASGMHREVADLGPLRGSKRWTFAVPVADPKDAPRASTFLPLWNAATNLVLKSSEHVPVSTLYQLWQAPPYGVRAGILPVLWLAFVLANQHHLALYKDGMFVPQLREVDVDEAIQDPSRFSLRHVHMDKNKGAILKGVADHLRRLGHGDTSEPLEAARGLVSLVFDLPPWTRRTQLLQPHTLAVRDTLAHASDPHKVLFVDLPILFEGVPLPKYLKGLGEALQELQSAYGATLQRVMERTLEALDASGATEADREALRERARNVRGISGDLRLEAFATRLSTLSTDLESVEGLLSLAVSKPPREWTDLEIDAALIQLAQLALQFRHVEAISKVQSRRPTRSAFAVVFGTGQEGKTVSETFDVSPREDDRIQELVDVMLRQFKDVKREVFLAALAQTGTKLVERANSKTRG